MDNSAVAGSGGRGTQAHAIPELIAKLEGAERSDRELDVLIHALIEGRETRWDGNTLLGRWIEPPHDECQLGWIDPGRVARNFTAAWSSPPFPAYTSDLNAILALIERELPGHGWEVRHNTQMRRPVGTIFAPDKPDAALMDPWPDRFEAAAGNPALALCIAFLKARSAAHPRALEEPIAGARDE